MQINYSLNIEDLKAFQIYALNKNAAVKKVNLFNYLFIFIISYWQLLYAILFSDFLRDFDLTFFLVYFVSGTLTFGFVLAFSKAISYFIRQYTINSVVNKHRDGDGILGEHLIRFDEDYIIEATEVNETRHSWKGVDRIEENQDYIFIYTSPVNAHIIPKRFFASEESVDGFFNEAKRLNEFAETKF